MPRAGGMATGRGTELRLAVPADFDLVRAVCSYGYFLLAPNRWEPAAARLVRPLWVGGDRPVTVTVRQGGGGLRARCDRRLTRAEQARVRAAVGRMLRLNESMAGWYARHAEARRAGFGRLFRSPTLFEDMVKTITTCNVAWPNTIRMNALLCERIGGGAFPTAERLAGQRPSVLKRRCKVGYRAERIVRLAREVASGRLDLAWFEDPRRSSDEVFEALRRIHGIGDYAAANLCQVLGHYDRLAIDSETFRHFRDVHGVAVNGDEPAARRRIAAHYRRYAPYDFLAYWYELWVGYEHHAGRPAEHWDQDVAQRFTASAYGSKR